MLFSEVKGVDGKLAITSRRHRCIGCELDRTGHHKSVVIVRVLANQIHPSRRAEYARTCLKSMFEGQAELGRKLMNVVLGRQRAALQCATSRSVQLSLGLQSALPTYRISESNNAVA